MTRRRSTYPGDAAIDWSRKIQGAAAGFACGSVIGSESPPGGGLPLPVCLLVRSLVGSLLVGCCRLCLSVAVCANLTPSNPAPVLAVPCTHLYLSAPTSAVVGTVLHTRRLAPRAALPAAMFMGTVLAIGGAIRTN